MSRTDTQAWNSANWLVRVHAPAWLRLAGLGATADRLADLPELTPDTLDPTWDDVRAAEARAHEAAAAAFAESWDAAHQPAAEAAFWLDGVPDWADLWAELPRAAHRAARDTAGGPAWNAAEAVVTWPPRANGVKGNHVTTALGAARRSAQAAAWKAAAEADRIGGATPFDTFRIGAESGKKALQGTIDTLRASARVNAPQLLTREVQS